ncbi:hypothetical protein, conserved [Leishmania tarentolae]|uniref:SAC3/GANP/THP3 conserved domain-containing protein n=1 Tax=Leishmania tarentolae TaxID=5689 RepID=A0A640KVM8_LEITA|nr:hypothetical protein, conserved [Leishmania tarentolae]
MKNRFLASSHFTTSWRALTFMQEDIRRRLRSGMAISLDSFCVACICPSRWCVYDILTFANLSFVSCCCYGGLVRTGRVTNARLLLGLAPPPPLHTPSFSILFSRSQGISPPLSNSQQPNNTNTCTRMSQHRDVLTAAFLRAHGVALSKPLSDWLTRVSFLARAQTSVEKKEKYERWALRTVEDAVKSPGGVASIVWTKQSVVMPPDSPDCTSEWWQESRRSCAAPSSSGGFAAYDNPVRAALLAETMRRSPAPLQPFVQQGFSLYDREVALGHRRYEEVTFVEMLNIAKSLQAKASPAPVPSPAPPLPSQPPPPPPSCKPLMALTATTPRTAFVQPTAQKRPAPEARAHEPPHKRVMPSTAPALSSADKTFFFQLAGITDAEVAAPREFVGLSTELERHYTRYEPVAEDIRPPAVLKEAYTHITMHATVLEKREGKKAAQKYLSDQLKGMRQDLRVQNVVDNFTVMVYEVHARLCLQTGDIGEFNQCQAGLKQFYAMDTVDLSQCDVKNFFLYRLVYLTLSGQYDSLSTELIHFTNAQLQGTDRVGSSIARDSVNRTLALCAACNDGDTLSLCRLLLSFETEMTYLVRIYLQKLRIMWLKEILTAMKGSLTLRFLMASLGFTPLPHGKKKNQLFWLDDAEETAELRFTELFQTLKVELPADFVFHAEVHRTKQTGPNHQLHYPSLDAATALKAVNGYLVFLGTRKDAARR